VIGMLEDEGSNEQQLRFCTKSAKESVGGTSHFRFTIRPVAFPQHADHAGNGSSP
jgi:hypothetical protein